MHDHNRKKKKDVEPEAREVPAISIDLILSGTEELAARKNAMLMRIDHETETAWVYRMGRKQNPA